MNTPVLRQDTASIVLLGSFNPSLCHPDWLLRNELVSDKDYEGSKVDIVHRDLARFSVGAFQLDVIQQKFVLRTLDASEFLALRDLACSVFHLLEHTPITAMGMNREIEFVLSSEDDWHKIGDVLAPKDLWKKVTKECGNPVTSGTGLGMLRLRMQTPMPRQLKTEKGYVNVKIEPSPNLGVVVEVNGHIDVTDTRPVPILEQHWEDYSDYAQRLASTVLSEAMQWQE
jgi:hypothetical protein